MSMIVANFDLRHILLILRLAHGEMGFRCAEFIRVYKSLWSEKGLWRWPLLGTLASIQEFKLPTVLKSELRLDLSPYN